MELRSGIGDAISEMTAGRQFNQPIHAFRGFAILNIVVVHAFSFTFYLAGFMENPAESALKILDAASEILFHDSTLYFALISGILFSMILQERGYARFYKSKFTYVVLPYLFFTTLYSWRHWNLDDELIIFSGTLVEFLEFVGTNLMTGGAIFSLWYIPVLVVLYIATPVFAKLLKTERAKWLNVAIVLSPLVITRVGLDVSWANYVYFLGAYMLGMYAGANYASVLEFVRRHELLFVVLALVMTAILVLLFSLDRPSWGMIRLDESAWYVQKIAISGLVLLWFDRSITTVPKWLDVLGNYAFAIYFLHAYLLFAAFRLLEESGFVLETVPVIVFWAIAMYVAILGTSVLITFIGKTVLGAKSRYFLGA
jgi:membrane-bound acyltransferase YfiQ involved in biofilm formation